MTGILAKLPAYVKGTVVKGFGRGSKELGIPTANFSENVMESLAGDTGNGIYFGLAAVDDSPVHKMVMSIGWNPYYKNTKKTMEVHVIHDFENDFYGSELRVIVLGHIRPEKDFSSLDQLIAEIHNDIRIAKSRLEEPTFKAYYEDPFLTKNSTNK
ncbi:Riboflavin kinase [Trichoplax sp. H2]|uniref:Riboflavin kinase n=1 Tax=Trichoplax adhaerens TaxID=10228 RepID=B3RHX0_TRIAD|nr:hypothetical protein TRIADDRAFT_52300 [Trichoplax adhaerens]EDV28933.1 hypothetical protein TRIADDRAFT_52300 [Trichoplax adhaerens]RDD38554.1 Riboflavin kinase [Trichoplax sp. H2]|eukprot:XP_002108135.1 hypothetical protein TRIADDRAFT_52300 [Trichoplax adhaerens]